MKGHVLVVDDEVQIQDVLRQVLEGTDYHVTLATNSKEALEIYWEAHGGIDIVVVDIILREKVGIDLIMDLRWDFPDVKIIAVCGGGMCGDMSYLDMALGVGADSNNFEGEKFSQDRKEPYRRRPRHHRIPKPCSSR